MSIMRSLVTGFVSPFVERDQVKFKNKAEMELYDKKLASQLTSNIALKEKRTRINNSK